jgi:uncharacterized protein (DUF885 family)
MSSPASPPSSLDAVEREVVDHVFRLQPGYAVGLGLHEYDGRLPDLAPAATLAWIDRADELLARLAELDDAAWPGGRRVDRFLLRLLLESPLFDLREARVLESNPMACLGSISLTPYLVRRYAPARDRVRAVVATLDGVPALLEAGRARLEPRLPRPLVEIALSIAANLPAHFAEGQQFADDAGLGSGVREPRERAEAAARGFASWLRERALPQSVPDFALGANRFQRLLFVREGIEAPFSEVRAAGAADLARNHRRLADIARAEGVPVSRLIDRLSADHPTATELLPTARALVEDVKQFVEAKRLVSVPASVAVRVDETPIFGRALSTASMDPPGPFDPSIEGVYYVTPVDDRWSPAQQEMWLKSLNRTILLTTTVHEVYPGHYLQYMHARAAPGSLARKVYQSNSFLEGWAHYTEQLTVEAGLGAPGPLYETGQILDALLRNCRLLSAIGLHTEGWSVERSVELFEREAHLERLPAEREAIRGTFDPGYFCYTLGKLAILGARTKMLQGHFGGDLLRFHDTLLATGAPPVGLLELLLETAGGAAGGAPASSK